MAGMDEEVTPLPEVLSYYAGFPEESRLGFGPFRLEFERTKEILAQVAAFQDVRILGIEGPAWMLPDFDARWENPALRKDLLDVARALESEPSVIAVSAHLLGIGRKP